MGVAIYCLCNKIPLSLSEDNALHHVVNVDLEMGLTSVAVSRARSSPVPGVVAYFRHGYGAVQE